MFKRIISATVGVLLMIAVLFVSDEYKYLFNIVVSILAAVSVGEIFMATKFISHKPLTITSIGFAAFIPFTTVDFIRPYAGIVIFAYAVFMLTVMLYKRKAIPLRDISLLFMLTVLIPFAFSMLIRLRDLGLTDAYGLAKRDGVFLLISACCCSWFADTGAYFTGRFLGKHKLAPEISPKKTVEGFIGGVAFNMLGMWGLSAVYMIPKIAAGATVNIPLVLIIAFVAAFLGTLGDLSASYIKRSCHVKDFGNIMPGHGGVMDRFDSILLVAPLCVSGGFYDYGRMAADCSVMNMNKKTLCILGSTGSIGTQCLDIIEQTDFQVTALAAANNIDLLEQQIRQFHPAFAAVENEQKAAELKVRVADTPTKVLGGRGGVLELAAMGCHTVLNSLVGIAGLLPTLTALRAGSHIALANKETLVTGGSLVMETARKLQRNILPVDSEHSAIFQCLQNSPKEDLQSLVLTASGGPFLGKTREQLTNVTKEQALAHPNWSMGQKISIDSATMMNKGLEVIEALHLFGVTPDQIQVVIHPESIVHSLVEWKDGALLAQLSHPDMRVPIQYALTYPHRIPSPIKRLNLGDFGRLTFRQPDRETFGCLAAAEEAIRLGGLYPAAVNGANEQAVAMFLQGQIGFLQIEEAVRLVLTAPFAPCYTTVEQVLEADATARELVLQHFS